MTAHALPPLPTPTPGSPRDGDGLALRREATPEARLQPGPWGAGDVPLSPPTVAFVVDLGWYRAIYWRSGRVM